MKRITLVIAIASLMLLLVGAGESQAAPSENITITVAVTPGLSISLSNNNVSLGSVDAGDTKESGSAVVVTNNGSGVAEVFTLSHAYAGSWTSGTTQGDETFVLNANFDGGSWTHVNSLVSGSVPSGGTKDLWFQFLAPSSTVTTDQQSMTVTVSAQLP